MLGPIPRARRTSGGSDDLAQGLALPGGVVPLRMGQAPEAPAQAHDGDRSAGALYPRIAMDTHPSPFQPGCPPLRNRPKAQRVTNEFGMVLGSLDQAGPNIRLHRRQIPSSGVAMPSPPVGLLLDDDEQTVPDQLRADQAGLCGHRCNTTGLSAGHHRQAALAAYTAGC